MADITEEEKWDDGVYQLETTDPVEGGAGGIDNKPHKALANRTVWLKKQIETVQNSISNFSFAALAGSATQKFKVAKGMADDEAVNKGQLDGVINEISTGYKNLIINGCKRVNQRLSTSPTQNLNAYNYDRWYYDGTYIIQFIEALNVIKSGTYTLSWEGTASAKVNNTTVANGGQITLTANTQVEVKFYSSDFNSVQMELGDRKTNFENRNYTLELLLCKRTYQHILYAGYVGIGVLHNHNSGYGAISIPLSLPLRTIPTLVSNWTNFNVTGIGAVNSVSLYTVSKTTFSITLDCTDSIPSGSTAFAGNLSLKLDAEIYPL